MREWAATTRAVTVSLTDDNCSGLGLWYFDSGDCLFTLVKQDDWWSWKRLIKTTNVCFSEYCILLSWDGGCVWLMWCLCMYDIPRGEYEIIMCIHDFYVHWICEMKKTNGCNGPRAKKHQQHVLYLDLCLFLIDKKETTSNDNANPWRWYIVNISLQFSIYFNHSAITMSHCNPWLILSFWRIIIYIDWKESSIQKGQDNSPLHHVAQSYNQSISKEQNLSPIKRSFFTHK